MKRLVLTGALLGIVGASLIAWEARESVAYAAEPPPTLQARPISQAVDAQGPPNLGVWPVKRGSR